MNYEEVVNFLEQQIESHSVNYLKNVLDLLKLKIDSKKVIIVAGTNGKGTTCATLQTLLTDAEKNVGFFSSPHLKKTTERIKFNGLDISENNFIEIFEKVKNKIGKYDLSHFEWLTFMATYYFFEIKNVDFAIFEVGLGGTYDSTNVIPHNTSVITRLAMDHQDILGNTLEKIAENKFGIISDHNFVFHTEFPKNIRVMADEYAKKLNARFIKSCDFSVDVQKKNGEPTFFIDTPFFGRGKLNLPGKRAAENTALALTIFDHLVGNTKEHMQAIEKVKWPGRMNKVTYNKQNIFLSGDHNPNGIESLLDTLQYFDFEKVRFVVGICKDKEYQTMLQMLHVFPNSEIYLTETPVKTLHIDEYDENCKKFATYTSSSPTATLQKAINDASADDLIIVTGSLYLVGEIYKFCN